MQIGKTIRKYRKEKGITQEEMAIRLGVTTPAVNKWEKGTSCPDITLLAPIARLLGISLDTLLSFQEELTTEEISSIILEVDERFKTSTYDEVYIWVKSIIETYPNCLTLIWQLATILDAQRLFKQISNTDSYDDYILKCYNRVLESDEEALRIGAADSLFGDANPVGKTIDIKGEPFIVIGVIEESTAFSPVINSVEDYYTYVYNDGSASGIVVIPDVDWNIVQQYDEPQNAKLLADSTDNMTSVGKAAQTLLNETVTSKSIKYRAANMNETAEESQQVSATTNKQLIWIASISLLVGGIGVMNIMLVSVTERTREIGLKKAIGARKNRILAQFLTEAAVLTSLGGIIGTITGIALAEIIGKISNVPIAISIPAVILAIAFSTVIGVVFGLLPAVKAANLDPIVALRHE